MTELGPDELVRLEVPALPAYVGVARTVATAVALGVDGIGDERLEDLRIAVSEACTNAVEPREGAAQRVVLRCRVAAGAFQVDIEDDGGAPGTGRVDDERRWGAQLIESLVDEVVIGSTGTGSAVSLRIVLHPAGPGA